MKYNIASFFLVFFVTIFSMDQQNIPVYEQITNNGITKTDENGIITFSNGYITVKLFKDPNNQPIFVGTELKNQDDQLIKVMLTNPQPEFCSLARKFYTKTLEHRTYVIGSKLEAPSTGRSKPSAIKLWNPNIKFWQ